MTLHFTHSTLRTSDRAGQPAISERRFTLDGVPGVLWQPSPSGAPTPLIVMGHPGGLDGMLPRLRSRARAAAALGCASATIELPGAGSRDRLVEVDRARAELRAALREGRAVSPETVNRLIMPLVEHAVPEWQRLIDELQQIPGIAPAVAISGGVAAIAVHLLATDSRISAAVIFAGSYIPKETMQVARTITAPVHMLLQWDDRGNDRQMALDLFDAFGSAEKTLEANLGGHTGVPAHAGEGAARFLARHIHPSEGA